MTRPMPHHAGDAEHPGTTRPPTDTARAPRDSAENDLCIRVLDAFLREDVNGLRGAGRTVTRPDGAWLVVRAGHRTAELPVRHSRFLCDLAARGPCLVEAGRRLTGLDALLDFLAAAVDPADAAGFAAFTDECRAALDTARLHARHRDAVFAKLSGRPARGMRGSLDYDTVAAYQDHPAYPTGRVRFGLGEAELLAHAPEFAATFDLRWAVVDRGAAELRGVLPRWWPAPSRVGMPDGLDGTHVALPVHPLTDPDAAVGGVRGAAFAPDPYLAVSPTLALRTVAPRDHPGAHLKIPLPTSTLGLRNRRTVTPGSLTDGAAGHGLLRLVLDAEPRFRYRVLVADEGTYGHAGHELLAFMLRRYPSGLDQARVVSVAALAAVGPGGRPVVAALADEYFDGDLVALYDAYLHLLLDWHVTLWLRYGIALDAHQQNTSLVLDRDGGGRTRLRLLLKDNDAPRVVPDRFRARLGTAADAHVFDDPRIAVHDGGPLADVFATITLHLCAAAPVFALAACARTSVDDLLALLRTRLVAAAARHRDSPDYPLLHERVLDAPHLPVKLMVTAGTLLDKARSGAVDVNKHYARTGPNYLWPAATVPGPRGG